MDEAAITGESAPVIRESGGDRSAVTGGTRVLSDRIVIRVTTEKGGGFLDRMIALVEGARRQKTPNEIALTILLAALTFIFLLVCVTLKPFGIYSGDRVFDSGSRRAAGLLDSDDDRRIAQRHRHRRNGSCPSAQRAGDERTRGRSGGRCRCSAARQNRHDHARQSHGGRVSSRAWGVEPNDLAASAQLSSLADETPEGRSIVVLAKEKFGLRAREMHELEATFVPFTAQTRMSGVDLHANGAQPTMRVRKGAAEAVRGFVESAGGIFPQPVAKDSR